jgi:Tfp pilus assembly protein PilO
MDMNRIWVIGGVFVMAVVAVLGVLVGVKPQLDTAGTADEQRSAVEAQNLVHAADLAAIKEQFTQLPELQTELATLRESLPAVPDIDGLLGGIHSLEATHGVHLAAFTPMDAAAFIPSADIAATVPASVSGSNFVSIPIELTVDGPMANVMAFIEGLQTGDRLFLASKLDVNEVPDSPGVYSARITGLIYVLLDVPIAPAVDPAAVVPADGVTDATGE